MSKRLKSLLLSSFVANLAGAQEAGFDLKALFQSDDDFAFHVTVKRDIATKEVIEEAELCLTNKCGLFELRGGAEDLTTLLDFVFI